MLTVTACDPPEGGGAADVVLDRADAVEEKGEDAPADVSLDAARDAARDVTRDVTLDAAPDRPADTGIADVREMPPPIDPLSRPPALPLATLPPTCNRDLSSTEATLVYLTMMSPDPSSAPPRWLGGTEQGVLLHLPAGRTPGGSFVLLYTSPWQFRWGPSGRGVFAPDRSASTLPPVAGDRTILAWFPASGEAPTGYEIRNVAVRDVPEYVTVPVAFCVGPAVPPAVLRLLTLNTFMPTTVRPSAPDGPVILRSSLPFEPGVTPTVRAFVGELPVAVRAVVFGDELRVSPVTAFPIGATVRLEVSGLRDTFGRAIAPATASFSVLDTTAVVVDRSLDTPPPEGSVVTNATMVHWSGQGVYPAEPRLGMPTVAYPAAMLIALGDVGTARRIRVRADGNTSRTSLVAVTASGEVAPVTERSATAMSATDTIELPQGGRWWLSLRQEAMPSPSGWLPVFPSPMRVDHIALE